MSDWLAQLKKSVSRPNGARRFAAVDFDSRRLRIVAAERVGDRTCIRSLWSESMPEGIDLADARAVGEFLGRTLRQLRLQRMAVVMNVPRGQAVLKSLSFPPGTREDELAAMVRYQVEKELPFRLEEAVIDFTVEGRHYDASSSPEQVKGISVLVAAVRLPVLDYYRQIALAAGVKLHRLGLRPYANHSCLDACTTAGADETRALVHLTADEAEIDVLIGESLAFSRSAVGKIPASGGEAPALDQAVTDVVTEAIRSLQSYQSVEHGGQVGKVYLAGATGIERRVAHDLGERLGVPCEILDPAAGLALSGGGLEASEFISALGLAIGHCADEGLRFDFLNPKRPTVHRDLRKVKVAAAAAAVVVLLATGLVARASHFRDLEAQAAKLRSDIQTSQAANKLVKAKAGRDKAIRTWEKESRHWLDHLAYITCLFPSARDAYVTGLKASSGEITFTIRASSEEVITEILSRLNKAGYDAKAGRQTKGKEGPYPHTADMRVALDQVNKIDLTSLHAETRPSDDAVLRVGPLPPGGPGTSAGNVAPRVDGSISRPPAGTDPNIAPRTGWGGPQADSPSASPSPMRDPNRPRWNRGGNHR